MALTKRDIAAIRFGYGFDAAGAGPRSKADLLRDVTGADAFRKKPVTTTKRAMALGARFQEAQRMIKAGEMAREDRRPVLDDIHAATHDLFQAIIARGVSDRQPFRERLVQFWADHFTVAMRGQRLAILAPAFHEDAIRPHITGLFADLLIAATTHPAMIFYLDNHANVGPNSRVGQRRGRGLNENLARELLELHTVGPEGGYSQRDVRELAELLTGLRLDKKGMAFLPAMAEPGAEEIMGRRYGGAGKAKLSDIEDFLNDIARHPRTASYIAWKLARHFTSDTPDQRLTRALSDEFLQSDGDLQAVYAVLLDHKASWQSFGQKVKQPLDYMISTARALGVTAREINALDSRNIRREILGPLRLMGQQMLAPQGPDGWPEEAEAWITAAGLAGRVQWSANIARQRGGERDPRDAMDAILGPVASDSLRWAVPKAANRAEGLALILASPDFNRR